MVPRGLKGPGDEATRGPSSGIGSAHAQNRHSSDRKGAHSVRRARPRELVLCICSSTTKSMQISKRALRELVTDLFQHNEKYGSFEVRSPRTRHTFVLAQRKVCEFRSAQSAYSCYAFVPAQQKKYANFERSQTRTLAPCQPFSEVRRPRTFLAPRKVCESDA